ncbi:hypothetical protein [Paraburkholderia acidiphila]|uniref:Uncharacterized protein n=1 Tax=Paraburkholderia acidiphila TaxID=2571747 RepID=A0A7Z2G3I5_9BURK|nr:hypothetical protein [Paraburkholderia acidiphila]QGZ54295.1 hypothetical protein FAZ97_04835 [Paraburkholderia acidiphila]
MANDTKQPDPPLRYVDITISLTGAENQLICAAIFRANKAGLLRDFVGHIGPEVFDSIFDKIAIASAEQGDPFAQMHCLRKGLLFGGGTGTAQ